MACAVPICFPNTSGCASSPLLVDPTPPPPHPTATYCFIQDCSKDSAVLGVCTDHAILKCRAESCTNVCSDIAEEILRRRVELLCYKCAWTCAMCGKQDRETPFGPGIICFECADKPLAVREQTLIPSAYIPRCCMVDCSERATSLQELRRAWFTWTEINDPPDMVRYQMTRQANLQFAYYFCPHHVRIGRDNKNRLHRHHRILDM